VTDYKVTLYNFQNVQYHGRFTLGDQSFPAIYDTGSFEILVLAESCSGCPHNLIKYDSSRSKTFQRGDAVTAEHHFGSGSVTSLKGLETARIGPIDSPLSQQGVHFWQIMKNEIPVWNENAAFSGIVGLGHTDRIPEGYGDNGQDQTFLAELGISSFAICLQRKPIGGPGMLVVNPSVSYNTPMFKTVPVLGEVHWGVEMYDLTVSGSYFNLCKPSCGAIVDSGTSLIAVPQQVLERLSPLLSNIKEDCSNLHSLPSLEFSLGGHRFFLPPKAYVQQVNDADRQNTSNSVWDVIWGKKERKNQVVCAPAFMQMEKQSQLGPVIILGMPFLRYHYTVFNRDMKALHIANANSDCTPAAQQGMMLSNFTKFSNSTGTFAVPSERPFDAEDYEPNKVSVEAMRAPDWAFGLVS
jgi:gastricsin